MRSAITNHSGRSEPIIRRNYVSSAPEAWHLQDRSSYLVLLAATLLCLLPFSGRAFSTDAPLFIWTAQNIVNPPLDPYGFRVNWKKSEAAMSGVTKNPPLASCYMAV